MADQFPSAYPALDVQTQPSNPLGTVNTFAELQNRLNQNRLFQATFQARGALGELAQQAVDPQTGQIDYDKYGSLISQDPRTAFMAPEMLNQMAQRQVQQQQLAGLRLDQTSKVLDMTHGLFASAAASQNPKGYIDSQLPAVAKLAPPGTQKSVLDNLIAYRAALEGLSDDQVRQVLLGHAGQAKMSSDAITMLHSNVQSGMTQAQLTEPTPLSPTTTGTRAQFIQRATGAPPAGGGLSQQTAQAESGGNPSARNSRSSATGLDQFTAGTWASLMKAHPELGLTPEGRLDPEQSERARQAYAQDNGMVLSRAGLPVTDANISLAHRYGPAGATAILQAPPNTPVEKVLSKQAVEVNGLAGMKTGDLLSTVPQGGGGAVTTPAPQGVQTKFSPQEETTQKNMADWEKDLNEGVQAIRPLAIAMKAERDASARFQMGGGAEVRGEIGKLLQAAKNAGAPISQDVIDKVANGSIADTQTFKAAMTPVIMGQFKQAVQGTGRGLMLEAKAYFDRYPGITTDPAAYENVSNMISRGAQQMVDEQQALPKFRQGIKDGTIKGYSPTDFPAWYNKQLIDKGELTFPTQTGYAKGSTNKPAEVTPAATAPVQSKQQILESLFGR